MNIFEWDYEFDTNLFDTHYDFEETRTKAPTDFIDMVLGADGKYSPGGLSE